MKNTRLLGQLEQMVMLSLLQLGDEAHAITIRRYLAKHANHNVTRGALYRTLDRLDAKGYVDWITDVPTPERDGYARRRFQVTPEGLDALKSSQKAVESLSRGLKPLLRGP